MWQYGEWYGIDGMGWRWIDTATVTSSHSAEKVLVSLTIFRSLHRIRYRSLTDSGIYWSRSDRFQKWTLEAELAITANCTVILCNLILIPMISDSVKLSIRFSNYYTGFIEFPAQLPPCETEYFSLTTGSNVMNSSLGAKSNSWGSYISKETSCGGRHRGEILGQRRGSL